MNCIRRPQADRRGTASAVRGNPFPRPPGGGRGDREVGLRSGPISRGETKTAAVWLPQFRFVDQTFRISNLRFLEGALEIQRFIDYCEKGD